MKIDFEFESPYGTFRDALHFPDDVLPSEAEVEAMKKQRYDNWWAIVNAPAPVADEAPPVEVVS
jgi:hypothetical protein